MLNWNRITIPISIKIERPPTIEKWGLRLLERNYSRPNRHESGPQLAVPD